MNITKARMSADNFSIPGGYVDIEGIVNVNVSARLTFQVNRKVYNAVLAGIRGVWDVRPVSRHGVATHIPS
jgi:hypothetical protein